MKTLTSAVTAGQALTPEEVQDVAQALLDDQQSIDDRADFLTAMAKRGETPAELAGLVRCFLEKAVRPPMTLSELDRPAIDVCGTGGDKLNLFNVSTTAVFILAGAGCAVVKHGNRGITSKSGGADVLEALGCRIDLPPAQFAEGVKRFGAGFMMAPLYHPAFKAIAPVRLRLAERGQRTLFNLIGPLLNPVRPDFQLVGVFSASHLEAYAEILTQLGRQRTWIVNGTTADGRGMDEVSILAPTQVFATQGDRRDSFTLDPAAWSTEPPHLHQLAGGDATTNASILEGILRGEVRGPKRFMAVINAAAGLVVAGLARDISHGREMAEEALDQGRAFAVLQAWRELGQA